MPREINRMDDADRTSESGFITILALLIMTALLSLATGYLGIVDREGEVANRLKRADQARQAAIAGTRLAAGALIKDLGGTWPSTYDGFDEPWFSLTTRWSRAPVPVRTLRTIPRTSSAETFRGSPITLTNSTQSRPMWSM